LPAVAAEHYKYTTAQSDDMRRCVAGGGEGKGQREDIVTGGNCLRDENATLVDRQQTMQCACAGTRGRSDWQT